MIKPMKHGEQKALAKKIGVSPQHLNCVLRGRKKPSPELAEKLEQNLGVDRRSWFWPSEFPNPYLAQAQNA